MIPFLELRSQYRALEQEIRAAVEDVLESGAYILGRQCAAFEEAFARYTGTDFCVGVNSGTDALTLALRAAGIERGDEVITAPNTCFPTVAAILNAGAVPVFADVDPETLTLDAAAAARAVTERSRAIVPVHLYGHPCDMGALLALGREHGLRVIEDCAQAHGALYQGRHCGTLGDAGAYSFYPTKNVGAYGDAGAIVTDDAGIAERAMQLRNYGEEARYRNVAAGVNSRLDEIQAAILRVKLRRLDAWNEERRERAAAYRDALEGTPVRLPVEAAWARHNYHLFVIRAVRREEIRRHLSEQGVETAIHYPVPQHRQPALLHLGIPAFAHPIAERACSEVLSLPLHPLLPLRDVERVAAAVEHYFRSGGG